MRCGMWNISTAAAAVALLNPQKKKTAGQPRRQSRRGNFPNQKKTKVPLDKKKSNNNNSPSPTLPYLTLPYLKVLGPTTYLPEQSQSQSACPTIHLRIPETETNKSKFCMQTKIFMKIRTYGKSIDFGESIIDYRIIVSSIWKNQKKSAAAAVAILHE